MVRPVGDSIYADNGCHVAPHCLPEFDQWGDAVPGTGCPLPRCIYDVDEDEDGYGGGAPRGHRATWEMARLKARQLKAEGYSAGQVAIMMNIGKRSVFRYWQAE